MERNRCFDVWKDFFGIERFPDIGEVINLQTSCVFLLVTFLENEFYLEFDEKLKGYVKELIFAKLRGKFEDEEKKKYEKILREITIEICIRKDNLEYDNVKEGIDKMVESMILYYFEEVKKMRFRRMVEVFGW